MTTTWQAMTTLMRIDDSDTNNCSMTIAYNNKHTMTTMPTHDINKQ